MIKDLYLLARVVVEIIKTFKLYLKIKFYLDLFKTFVVPFFGLNLISIFILDKFGFSYSFEDKKVS